MAWHSNHVRTLPRPYEYKYPVFNTTSTTYIQIGFCMSILNPYMSKGSSVDDSHSSQPTTSIPSQEIPHILRNKTLITIFKTTHHLHPSCARWIQSTLSHPISWRSGSIYYSCPHPDLPCAVFPSGFTPTISPSVAKCPVLPFSPCTIWPHENV